MCCSLYSVCTVMYCLYKLHDVRSFIIVHRGKYVLVTLFQMKRNITFKYLHSHSLMVFKSVLSACVWPHLDSRHLCIYVFCSCCKSTYSLYLHALFGL